jgi:hypothetical protein
MKTTNFFTFRRAVALATITLFAALSGGCSKDDNGDAADDADALSNGEKFAKELCDCAKKSAETERETCAYNLGIKYALQMYNPQTGAIDQKFFDDYEAWLVKNCTANWEGLDD